MTNLDSILKSRDITLPTEVHLAKAMVFPVVMYGCKSWTVKKAERRRIDAFELWCWRRLLRVPFLEEISSLSHSVVFLCFFALIAEEGFLISPCYSLELCIQIGISFRSEERRVGKEWKQYQTLFLGAPKSLHMLTAAMKLKDAYFLEEKL